MSMTEKWLAKLPPRIGPRIRTAMTAWNITTLDELATAHADGKTKTWRGTGELALVEIDKRVKPILRRRERQQELDRRLPPPERKAAEGPEREREIPLLAPGVKIKTMPAMDPIERQARNICRHADSRKSTHRVYWDRPLDKLAGPDRAKVEIAIEALKSRDRKVIRPAPGREIAPAHIANAILHELIEDVGYRTAQKALETGLAKDVTAARRWYMLATDVRDATERRMMRQLMA